jgi:hypothetical protein
MDVTHPPAEVQEQLDRLSLDAARPLLAVDVDEVVVGLAGHLAEYAADQGYALRLTGYKLDGALWRYDGTEASAEEFQTIFRGFFETQTLHQRVYDGAAEALGTLSRDVEVIILTNVPFYAHDDRIENLRGHGIDFPVVANAGPKGPALRWLHERAGRMAFIDDSPAQLASSAKHAPDVARIHFIGDEALRVHLAEVEAAQHHAESWTDLHAIADKVLLP